LKSQRYPIKKQNMPNLHMKQMKRYKMGRLLEG
jgi:hypothetical protein